MANSMWATRAKGEAVQLELLSVRGWFPGPPQTPKSMDAQVHQVKWTSFCI